MEEDCTEETKCSVKGTIQSFGNLCYVYKRDKEITDIKNTINISLP